MNLLFLNLKYCSLKFTSDRWKPGLKIGDIYILLKQKFNCGHGKHKYPLGFGCFSTVQAQKGEILYTTSCAKQLLCDRTLFCEITELSKNLIFTFSTFYNVISQWCYIWIAKNTLWQILFTSMVNFILLQHELKTMSMLFRSLLCLQLCIIQYHSHYDFCHYQSPSMCSFYLDRI